MTSKEKEQVLDWLSEVAKFPENFQSIYYSESEIGILANNALLWIDELNKCVKG